MRLIPTPLTPEAFAPFGAVITTDGADSFGINGITCQRFDSLARVDCARAGGTPVISIFRAVPWPEPLEIKMVERHPLGSQAFYPLHGRDWLVVVAEGSTPIVSDLRVFQCRGDQGVQFNRGTWHHPLIVMGEGQDFLVVDRAGEGDNCDEIHFPGDPATITLST